MNARIAVLPGDGVGPEVVGGATLVLQAVADRFGHTFTMCTWPVGGVALRQGQPALPPDTLEACRSADAILLGAVGDPAFDQAPVGSRPESALLALRSTLGLFANLRPARIWPGLEPSSPLRSDRVSGTDLVIVRELIGGLYFGQPRGLDGNGAAATNTLRYTRHEVERVARVAFDLARGRRGLVTSVDKANVLETSQLWRRTVTEVSSAYPDLRLEHQYVDSCAMSLVSDPHHYDVVLTENLFGDILSDEAGAIVGSLGLLPSASIGLGPPLFEPVHGSAPPLAGLDRANPIGAILSGGMLLRYGLRLEEEARAIEEAVARVLGGGLRTADLQGDPARVCRCSDMARAVAEQVGQVGGESRAGICARGS